MKNEQKEEAKKLYVGNGLTKTEIAGKIGVNRKTVLLWSQQENWDRLKRSARHLPSMIAEKCYHLIDLYATQLLSNSDAFSTLSLRDAQFVHLMASSIKKIKNRSTVNESMELFDFFLGDLNGRNPELASQIAPAIEDYICLRNNIEKQDLLPEEFNMDGAISRDEAKEKEEATDAREYNELMNDFQEFMKAREQATAQPGKQAA